MPTMICSTIVHNATASIAGLAGHLANALHRGGHALHRASHTLHHPFAVARHAQRWFEIVCMIAPAVVVGGGLLIPQPANPPWRLDPPGLSQPVPAAATAASHWRIPSTVAETPTPPVVADVPEPSSGKLLLAAVVGLMLIRFAIWPALSAHASNGPQLSSPEQHHPAVRRPAIAWLWGQ
jgi:hypothetical protein